MDGWIKLGGGMRRWMLLKEMIELNLHLFSLPNLRIYYRAAK